MSVIRELERVKLTPLFPLKVNEEHKPLLTVD